MKRCLLFMILLLLCTMGTVMAEDMLVLPDDTNIIEESAFENCSSIKEVTIPVNTTMIAQGAFAGCRELTDVYFHGTRDEWENIEIGEGNGPLLNAVLHCKEPLMYLTSIPAYGEHKNIEGVVLMGDGSTLDISAYKVTAYIYTPWGWYVKPTDAKPFVTLDSNGYFSLQYDTGGENDRKCTMIEVLLLPAEYAQGNNMAMTEAAALDRILITRSEDGTVACEPDRDPEEPYEYHNKRARLSVHAGSIAMDAGLFLNGERPGTVLSEETIRTRFRAIEPYCDTVRFYGAGGTTYAGAYDIANSMGFDVIGGAWISGSESADRAELDALIDMCNDGKCVAACVGSEALLSNYVSVSELVAYIDYVRARIPASIPVTCADSIDIVSNSMMLQYACDFFFVNCYPFWGGVSIENAMYAFNDSVSALQACDPTKQIIISETGWPTEGYQVGQAVPNDENAAAYFDAMRKWSSDHDIVVCYFEAFDERWKGKTDDDPERHWGLWDAELELKPAFEGDAFLDRQ